MDPFAAISFAGNVIQFASTCLHILQQGHEIYKSASGSAVAFDKLEELARGLRDAALSQQNNNAREPGQNESIEEKDLRLTADVCARDADRVLMIVKKLRGQGKRTRWTAMKQSFSTVWKKRDIDDMNQTLTTLCNLMNTRMLAVLKNDQSLTLTKIGRIAESSTMQGRQLNDLLEQLRVHLAESRLEDGPDRHIGEAQLTAAARVAESAKTIKSQGELLLQWQYILDSLRFDAMTTRQTSVTEATRTTLDWIFESENVLLSSWLRRDGDTFWISGKTGSGKSTLAKHLVDSPLTQQALSLWHEDHKLIMASHFFWKSGSDIQSSKQGFLRSVIHQMISQYPPLVQTIGSILQQQNSSFKLYDVAQRHFRASGQALSALSSLKKRPLEDRMWSPRSLEDAFRTICAYTTESLHFFLVVDGLDECKDDHVALCRLINDVSKLDKVKLEFLNADDIRKHVNSSLQEIRELNLELDESAFDYKERTSWIPKHIVGKSEGVFLWAHLAMKSITHGIINGDLRDQLEARMEALPSDLDDLIIDMFDGIDKIYQADTLGLLRYYVKTRRSTFLLAFPVSSNAIDSIDPFAGLAVSRQSLVRNIRNRWRRVNAVSNGLMQAYIEVDPPMTLEVAMVEATDRDLIEKTKINFFHTTVIDVLRKTRLHENEPLSNVASPYSQLCLGYLSMLPYVQLGTDKQAQTSIINSALFEAIRCIEQSEAFQKLPLPELTDWLAQTLRIYKQRRNVPKDCRLLGKVNFWMYFEAKATAATSGESTAAHVYDLFLLQFTNSVGTIRWYELLCQILRHGHTSILNEAALDSRMLSFPDIAESKPPSIFQAFLALYRHSRMYSPKHRGDIMLLQSLLKAGLDPNTIFEGRIVWIEAILPLSRHPWSFKAIAPLIQLLLGSGANPNASCVSSGFGVYMQSPREIVEGEPNTPWTIFLYWLIKQKAWHKSTKSDVFHTWTPVIHSFLLAGADTSARLYLDGSAIEPQTVLGILHARLEQPDLYILDP